MQLVSVEIKGVTPYLMHRFSDEASVETSTRRIRAEKVDPREEAERVAYKAPDGTYYFSSLAIIGSMCQAGTNHKQKGSRKSLRFVVPCAIRLTTDTIIMRNGDGKPAKSFEVDARPITIPATKGRIMRYRPRFNDWSAAFEFNLNEKLLGVDDAHLLLNEAGEQIGIGDFRPEKRGPFGIFRVTKFEAKPRAS
jgi:hypothetical protein